MRADALDETFALLAALDRRHQANPRDYPVIASHGAYRFGHQRYNLDEPTVRRIAERDGVVGLILARHQLEDGRRRAKKLEQSVNVFCDHAERIAEITGSHRHVALGSDFDGFIKPTMAGLASAADLPELRPGLVKRFGSANADAILFDNTHRVVRTALAARG
jgi:microsomal dipeptidase-like Zn-dependent dipeptidase